MSHDPKADLIYAILAMDVYNRGYGSGITELAERGLLGTWSIGLNASERFGTDAFTAGFYALAYRKGGETVVSYRGTDVKGPFASDTRGGSDPLNGYGLAV